MVQLKDQLLSELGTKGQVSCVPSTVFIRLSIYKPFGFSCRTNTKTFWLTCLSVIFMFFHFLERDFLQFSSLESPLQDFEALKVSKPFLGECSDHSLDLLDTRTEVT